MVKKNSKYRKPKKPAKKISLRKESNISHLGGSKKITLKKSKSVSNIPPKNQKSNLKEKNGNNSELITQSFFDAQSSIKLQCCFCSKSLNNSIKVILEPFPKNTKENFNFIKKSFLPFEVSCLKCFIIKAKINNLKKIESQNYFYNDTPHQYTDYHIISKMTEPIFTDDWTFGDEIKLLGALSHLGIGNWEDISNVLGKGKFECKAHYHAFYYKKQNDYFPNINNSNLNDKNKINERKKNKSLENKLIQNIAKVGYIPFNNDDNNQVNRSININRNNSKSEHINNNINQNAYNTLGYWPKRQEFDVEYKNDAEIELMEVDFKENKENKEQEKLNEVYNKILNDYNNILNKRDERKNFVLENNLYDVKKQFISEKKLEKEDREIYQSMKQNLKYLTSEQFKEYFEGIILEKNIKTRLNQLLYYSKMGYKTYGQIYKYIYELKQKSNKMKSRYDIKNNLKNLNVSLRESTVKQVDKLEIK